MFNQLITPDLTIDGKRAHCLQTCRLAFGLDGFFASASKNYEWLKNQGLIYQERPSGVYCLAWFELPIPDGDVIIVAPDGKGYGSPHKNDNLDDRDGDGYGWAKLRVYDNVSQASAQRGVGKLLGYSLYVEKAAVAEFVADPIPEADGIKDGISVRLLDTATNYATGETIPDWVKAKEHIVGGSRVAKAWDGQTYTQYLLSDIMSWVVAHDVATPETETTIRVGDKVKLKQSATNYATGPSIPNWVKSGSHPVGDIREAKAWDGQTYTQYLLSDIKSWVVAHDVEKA